MYSNYDIALSQRGCQRLAADVILTAINDYFLYHSADGQRLCAANAAAHHDQKTGKIPPREWRRLGVVELRAKRSRLVSIVDDGDPAKFLLSHSLFHEMLNISPARIYKILVDPVALKRLRAHITIDSPCNMRRRGLPVGQRLNDPPIVILDV